jgi:hypothetical protein
MPSYSLPADLVVDDVLLSADGTRCRYLASDQRTTHLFVDGESLGSWATSRGQARQLASSPDLQDHAWVSRGEGSVKVVTSKGNQFGPYSEVGVRSEAFAGGQLKFVARRGAQSFVQLGDEHLGPFAEVGDLGILDESGAIAFAFRRGRSWFAWIDGRETGPYEGLVFGIKRKKRGPPRIRRLADGRPVVLGGAGKHFALHVDKETEILRCSRVSVEVCASRVILECGRDPTTVLLDGKVLAEVETVRSIRNALGPGGKRVGFAFDQASFAGFYLDGKRSDGFGYTDGPWWSDDGTHPDEPRWGAGLRLSRRRRRSFPTRARTRASRAGFPQARLDSDAARSNRRGLRHAERARGPRGRSLLRDAGRYLGPADGVSLSILPSSSSVSR